MKDFRKAQDQHIAKDNEAEQALMCSAHGCPNRWSVDGPSGRCCSAHAWAPTGHWPGITAQQNETATQRAFAAAQRSASIDDAGHRTRPASPDEREAIARALQGGAKARGVQWAKRLLVREGKGERLTLAQREMWRDALMVPRAMSALDARAELVARRSA